MSFSLLIYRSCWVCFATDEDDRTAEWVRPCRCRGSTKWVHQACLQRWVDEKQRGNSTARVACPQCNAEYLIVFPKLGKKILKNNTDICDVIIHNCDLRFILKWPISLLLWISLFPFFCFLPILLTVYIILNITPDLSMCLCTKWFHLVEWIKNLDH